MRAFLRSLGGALSAERLKLRRTLALRLTVIAPAVVVVLCVLQFGFTKLELAGDPVQAWKAFAGASFALWAFLMMPLFATLEAALLGALEHTDRQWKHLLALPVPRSVHYLAKWAALVGLLYGTALVFAGLVVLGGWVLMAIRPDAGIAGWPPVGWLAKQCLAMVTAALCMAAIQLWVAVRWSSFTVAVGVGMGATIAGFMIGQSRYGHLYPWTLPVQLFARDAEQATFAVAYGILGAGVVLALSLWEFSRREVE
jgi:hypothetical protein